MTLTTKIDLLDLRSITRYSDTIQSIIRLNFGYSKLELPIEFIRCGAINISLENNTISARLNENCTDFEHDSAFAFRFDVCGIKYCGTRNGVSEFEAFFHPQTTIFEVPSINYDFFKNSKTCTDCKEHHPIVNYSPPSNLKLFELVKKARLEITLLPKIKEIID